MTTSPYSFPLRSRKAITEFLAAHDSYHPMNSWNGGFCLAWNIKVNMNFDTSGKHGEPVNAKYDDAWLRYLNEDNGELFNLACENGLRHYVDDEWTNYPGIEQGEWRFTVNGRSGGWLLLENAPAWLPKPHGWKSHRMTWDNRSEYNDWLAELDFATLMRFYRAVVVLDADLSKVSIRKEMEYQFSDLRASWEEDQTERDDARAQKMADDIQASRPDMYQQEA
jgi:hypothetical protein